MASPKHKQRTLLVAAGLLATLSAAQGCGSNKLETGYQYTPLGATPTQRRAYYAGPFSPEARQAMMENGADADSTPGGRHRPGM